MDFLKCRTHTQCGHEKWNYLQEMNKIEDDHIKQNKINPEGQTLCVPGLFLGGGINQLPNYGIKIYC